MTQKSSRPAGGAFAPIGDRRKLELPARDAVKPDTPLRLAVAAALAYPDGSMTANGLRNEARRGRLEVELTAGKTYTTLAAIGRMRELCRVAPPARTCASAAASLGASSSTVDFERAHSALKLTLRESLEASSTKGPKARDGEHLTPGRRRSGSDV